VGDRDVDSVRERVGDDAFAQRVRMREQGCSRKKDRSRETRAHPLPVLLCCAVITITSPVYRMCVFVGVCMCGCECVCVCACACACVLVSGYVCVCARVCVREGMRVCASINVYAGVRVCVCICVEVYDGDREP